MYWRGIDATRLGGVVVCGVFFLCLSFYFIYFAFLVSGFRLCGSYFVVRWWSKEMLGGVYFVYVGVFVG